MNEDEKSLLIELICIFLVDRGLTSEFSEWISEQKVDDLNRLIYINKELNKRKNQND